MIYRVFIVVSINILDSQIMMPCQGTLNTSQGVGNYLLYYVIIQKSSQLFSVPQIRFAIQF
jgi:hypothetical protein